MGGRWARSHLAGTAAIFGIILLFFGLALFGYFLHLVNLDDLARSSDGINERMSSGGCLHALKSAVPPTRTPAIGESVLIVLTFVNPDTEDCDVTVSLDAAGFDKDPSGPAQFTLAPGTSTKYWTISPKAAGSHEVLVRSDLVDITFGMQVLSNQFFGASTTLVLSSVLSMLGPMATIPWWIDFYRRRKDEAAKRKRKGNNKKDVA
jgi:hypothetical protein